MSPNPVLGLFFHWLGGLASASFYVPYHGVRRWCWETYWLVGGLFSWIIAPWFVGHLMTQDLLAVLSEASTSTLFWAFFFGLLWGIGGLTFGLTMRFLGLSLEMAVALGLCAAFGTLMPPIFSGVFVQQVLGTSSGRVILLGIVVCLLGMAAAGLAGIFKERAMSPEQQKAAIEEFDLKKGLAVATLSGVMSACFAYGLAAGAPIKALTLKHGTRPSGKDFPSWLWCCSAVLRRTSSGALRLIFATVLAINTSRQIRKDTRKWQTKRSSKPPLTP
jgi:L-rhamnose-H+ transport protein